MELFSPEFFSALFAIVIIDLVLAGDNAIVIALAARSVPKHLQKRAILWGTAGAIAVRSGMTALVVWLLKIPGLMLGGGLVLVWIAYKLLLPAEQEPHATRSAAGASFWGALKTIVIADSVMGLDNVLAVAGAAHGSFLLVILGLLISIPIVIWGSTLILKFVDRYPFIIFLGASVLAWTAAKMITGEPLLIPYLALWNGAIVWLAYAAVVGGVLVSGYRHGKEIEAENHAAQLFRAFLQSRPESISPVISEGGSDMLRVLLPVDGSENSRNAVRHVIREYVKNRQMEIWLLNVQVRFSRHISRFLSRKDRDTFHREQGAKALQTAKRMLDKWGIPYRACVELGEKAETINAVAIREKVDLIVMGTARNNSLIRMVEASVSNRVVELSRIPVELIPGSSMSKLERYGIPAGIGVGLLLLLMD